MIQRIQSVYLLLVALISGVVGLFIPFWPVGGNHYTLLDFLAGNDILQIIISVSFIMVSILAVWGLMTYKNRLFQMRLNRVNMILNILLFGLLLFYLLNLSGESMDSVKGIGVWLPWISIGLLLLANRSINKDENLVKSVDRIR